MTDLPREPKLVLPFLQRFYQWVIPLSWPIVRIACGMHLVIHGWGKIMRGGTVSNSTLAFGIFLTVIEFAGGLCISIGLVLRGGRSDRNGLSHLHSLWGQWLWLADRWLRIGDDVGHAGIRDRAAWRRALSGRPRARPRAVRRSGGKSAGMPIAPLSVLPVTAT